MGGRGEEGSLSLFFLGCSLAFLGLVGLVLDGGGRVLAAERADAVAREAARAACEQINVDAVLGGNYRIDTKRARLAAAAYYRAAGAENGEDLQGSPPQFPPGQDTCTTEVTMDYQTQLLSLIGITSIRVTGHGTAEAFHGITNPEGPVGN